MVLQTVYVVLHTHDEIRPGFDPAADFLHTAAL
jgi:hypothetical protein